MSVIWSLTIKKKLWRQWRVANHIPSSKSLPEDRMPVPVWVAAKKTDTYLFPKRVLSTTHILSPHWLWAPLSAVMCPADFVIRSVPPTAPQVLRRQETSPRCSGRDVSEWGPISCNVAEGDPLWAALCCDRCATCGTPRAYHNYDLILNPSIISICIYIFTFMNVI